MTSTTATPNPRPDGADHAAAVPPAAAAARRSSPATRGGPARAAEAQPAAPQAAAGQSAADLVDQEVPRAQSAAIAFVSQGVSSATNFLRLVFIARVCTEGQIGDYALGMTLVTWIMAVHERLVQTPYTVFAHRYEKADRGRLLGNTVLGSLASTGPPALLLILVGLCGWFTSGLRGMGPTLMVVGCVAPVIILRELARSAAFANFRMWTGLAIDVATLVVQAGAIALLWGTDTVAVATLYASVALSCVAAVAGWLVAWRGRWKIDRSQLARDWGELWSYSRWLLVGRLMSAFSRLLVPWVVVVMVGKFEAGQLAACVTLVGFAWMFIRGLSNFFTPHAIKSHQEGGATALSRAIGLMAIAFTVLLVPLCLLMLIAGEGLLTAVYGSKLAGAGMVAFLLTLNTLATSWSIPPSIGLLALDRPRDHVGIEATTLLATLLPAPLMIASWGISGAVGAMLVGNLAGATLALLMFLLALRSAGGPGAAAGGNDG